MITQGVVIDNTQENKIKVKIEGTDLIGFLSNSYGKTIDKGKLINVFIDKFPITKESILGVKL